MAVAPTAAHECEIKRGDGATSESFAEILGVHNGPNGPTRTNEIITARHHGATGTIKKASFADAGQVSFDIYYDSTDTVHQGLLSDYENQTLRNFQMVLTDTGAEQYAFAAIVAQFQNSAPVEGWNVVSVVLEISGDITTT